MKYEVLNIDNYIIHKYDFNDLTSLIDYINKNELNKNWCNEYHSILQNQMKTRTSGTNTFEEAVDLCLHGEQTEYSKFINIKKNLEELFPYSTQKRIIEEGVYGFRPNINKFLTNRPNSMYKLVRKEEKKFIDIYFNVASSGRMNTKEAIFHRGIFTILLIELLERNNYRVQLNFIEFSCIKINKQIKEIYYCNVNLKTASQRLNSYLTIFPMCNASYLRRIMFALKERTNFDYIMNWKDYGVPITKDEIVSNFSEILNIKDNSIIISSPNELGIAGDNILNDLKNFLKSLNISNYFNENEILEYDNNQKKFVLAKRK